MHYVTCLCLQPVPAQQWQLSQESFHGLQRPWLPWPYGVNQNWYMENALNIKWPSKRPCPCRKNQVLNNHSRICPVIIPCTNLITVKSAKSGLGFWPRNASSGRWWWQIEAGLVWGASGWPSTASSSPLLWQWWRSLSMNVSELWMTFKRLTLISCVPSLLASLW